MKINTETITGKSNETVKWVGSLFDKRGRDESESFVVEGIKLTREAADAGLNVTHLVVKDSRFDLIMEELSQSFSSSEYEHTRVIRVADHLFDKISSEKAPQGVIAVIKYLDFFRKMDIIYKEDFFLSDAERCIVLCSLRDPSNLGAVIRSAVAFGVDHVVLSADSADLYNPKTLRAAMGSIFRVKATVVSSLEDFISAARENGRRVFAAELSEGAVALDEVVHSPTDAVIIGNEGHGIPREIAEKCDASVYIPISKKTESLNASVAAAIFMWEMSSK